MMKIGLHHCVVAIIICEKNVSHDIKNYSSMLIVTICVISKSISGDVSYQEDTN